jgi:hypothetical protein
MFIIIALQHIHGAIFLSNDVKKEIQEFGLGAHIGSHL